MADKIELDKCVVLEDVEIIKVKGMAVNIKLGGEDGKREWLPLSQVYLDIEDLQNLEGAKNVSLLVARWVCDANDWEYSEEIPASSLIS